MEQAEPLGQAMADQDLALVRRLLGEGANPNHSSQFVQGFVPRSSPDRATAFAHPLPLFGERSASDLANWQRGWWTHSCEVELRHR